MTEDTAPAARAALWAGRVLRHRAWLWAAIVNAALQAAILLPSVWRRSFGVNDVDAYVVAAQHAATGQQLYPLFPTGDLEVSPNHYLVFLYPPPFAALVSPLGHLPYAVAVRLLVVLCFACFWAYAGVLVALATGRKPTIDLVLRMGLLLTLTPGAVFNLMTAQVEPLLWLLFALAFATRATGALLAASCLVKPFALYPLLTALAREPRRVLLPALVTGVVGLAIGAWVCGPDSFAQWLAYTPGRMYKAVLHHTNVSLAVVPLRLLGWTVLPDWGRVYLTVMQAAVALATAWLPRRRPAALQAAWVGVVAVLCAPFSHSYYLPLALTALALEYRHALHPPDKAKAAVE